MHTLPPLLRRVAVVSLLALVAALGITGISAARAVNHPARVVGHRRHHRHHRHHRLHRAVHELTVKPAHAMAGKPVKSTLKLKALRRLRVRSIGIVVRGASGHRLRLPASSHPRTLHARIYHFVSRARRLKAGHYKIYGYWRSMSGRTHRLTARRLVVKKAKASAISPVTTTPVSTTPVTTTTTTTTTTPQPDGVQGSWNMVLNSDFDTSSLDTNIWTPGWYGTGITDPVNSGEDNCYSSNNVVATGSDLHLDITDQSSTCNGKTYPYTGALMSSQPNGSNQGFLYTYGVVEARVYIPAAANGEIANWPAVWSVTTPSETYGENDAFEGLVGQACYHYHNNSGAPGGCDVPLTPGWHTFASDWQRGSITYYYDGRDVGSESSTTTQPMYVILDNTTNADPTNLDQASTMQVQYVRVWQN